MEHGSKFNGLNFLRLVLINTGKPPTKHTDSFIALSFHGIKLCDTLVLRLSFTQKIQKKNPSIHPMS
jgi:hypothetical protein